MNKIVKYSSNEKTVLLNKENMNWVRMSTELYRDKSQNRKEFQEELNDKFDFYAKNENDSCIESIHIVTTKRCNMSCDFCSMNCAPDVSIDDELTIAELNGKVIPLIQRLSPSLKKVIISGGEPLTKVGIKEFVKKIADLIGKEHIVFQTNGLLLNAQTVDFLINNVGTIEISIENLFLDNNQYIKIHRILEGFQNKKIRLSFSYVVTPYNMEFLEKGLELAAYYNAYFQYRIVSPVGKGKAFSIDLFDQVKLYQRAIQFILNKGYTEKNLANAFTISLMPKKQCGAANDILTLSSDGRVYMCPNMLINEFKVGETLDDADKIVENHRKKSSSFQVNQLFYVDEIPKCHKCIYKFFCCGECAANCINEFGERKSAIDCGLQKIITYYAMFVKDSNYKNNFEQLNNYLRYVLDNFEQVEHMDFFGKEIKVDYEL